MFYFSLVSVLALFSHALAGASQYTTCGTCTNANKNILATYCWNPDPESSSCQDGVFGFCASGTTKLAYNCPVAPPSAFPYTDDFGRNKVVQFLAATYGNDITQAQECLNSHANSLPGVTVLAQFNQANCSALLSLNPQDQAIVVAFRGSVGLEQLITLGLNLFLGPQLEFPTGGTVYAYYYSCFFSLWLNGLGAQLQATKIANPGFELWSFGHSLGGSLASMTSSYAVANGLFTSDKVKEITTGQTRTGNAKFAQGHDNLVPNAYRIVNQGDWITKLPPKLDFNNPDSFHHRHEVWYPTSMAPGSSFNVYNQAEDPTGSNSQGINLSDSSHNTYFNAPIDTWVNTHCQ